jgi:hypothetical protein
VGREPPSQLRRVALAGVDVNVFVSVFTVAMDEVFAVECIVFVKWLVGSKAVSVDCDRLLCAVRKQESNYRFVCGFRWDDLPLSSASISGNKHRWLVTVV